MIIENKILIIRDAPLEGDCFEYIPNNWDYYKIHQTDKQNEDSGDIKTGHPPMSEWHKSI